MSVIFVLLPIALLLAAAAVAGFVWAVRNGQYDDVDTPALRLLDEDEPAGKPHPTRNDSVSRSG